MNVEQFISDAHELSVLLCQRFNQRKIYLVGHSWGSALGALTVERHPELYYAYVGIGQVVNMREGERISYEWTLAQAEKARDSRSVAKLRKIGAPPYSGDLRSKVVAQRGILGKYGGEVYGNPRGGLFIVLGCLLKATEYSWPDRINFFRGIFASMRLMWPQILSINLMEQAPELKVPVYFLEGRHDYEAPSSWRSNTSGCSSPPARRWFGSRIRRTSSTPRRRMHSTSSLSTSSCLKRIARLRIRARGAS